MGVDLFEELPQLADFHLLLEHLIDLQSKAVRRHAEVSLQDLTHVHSRRHTQRVQDDINRLTVVIVGHIFHGHDD